jgi:hypothetical protein
MLKSELEDSQGTADLQGRADRKLGFVLVYRCVLCIKESAEPVWFAVHVAFKDDAMVSDVHQRYIYIYICIFTGRVGHSWLLLD